MCRIEWLSGNDFFDKRDGADYPQDKANIRKYRICIALLRRKYKILSSLPIFWTMNFRPRNIGCLHLSTPCQRS